MRAWPYTVAALALLLLIANRRAQLAAVLAPDPVQALPDDASGIGLEQTQGTPYAGFFASIDPATYLPTMNDQTTTDANRAAMLMAIRKAEGTAGPDGYSVMFGYRHFSDFSDHPRSPAQFTDQAGRRLWTSAAGAYQFMAVSPLPGGGSTRVDTWDRMAAKLSLPDFSPASQDAAAIGLIDEAGALGDVDAGRFDTAVSKLRGIWASLPGAGYAQPERSLDFLRTAYLDAGGTLA